MRVFGLTGGICAGKSTVAGMFREEGIPVVDADGIAREIVGPGSPAHGEIVRAFGKGILLADGGIDRRKLGAIVFADPSKRRKLEEITHPPIAAGIASALARLESEGHRLAIVEAALIHEKGRGGLFEAVIAVLCDKDLQVRRLVLRDGISDGMARERIASQMDPEEKARASDIVIDNSGDLRRTRSRVRDLVSSWKS